MHDLILRVRRLLPLEKVYVSVATLDAEATIVGSSQAINLDFPTTWLAHYRNHGLMKIDPAAGLLFKSERVIRWADLRQGNNGFAAKRFYGEAAAFGLVEGFSFGSQFPRQQAGSFFTCAGGNELATQNRHSAVFGYLAPFLHEAILKIQSPEKAFDVALTARETEVLKWLKSGKSDRETSLLLGTSQRTIKFHVQNAMRKLQAKTRTEAVVRAISVGKIALD